MDSDDSDSEALADWVVADEYRTRYGKAAATPAADDTTKLMTVAVSFDKSKMKFSDVLNALRSVCKKIELKASVLGSEDFNTEDRSKIKLFKLRIPAIHNPDIVMKAIQMEAPKLNFGHLADILEQVNAHEFSWSGLFSLLQAEPTKQALQSLLDESFEGRFLVSDLAHLQTQASNGDLITRGTVKAKLIDKRSSDLDTVDELIISKPVVISGFTVNAVGKGLNLYREWVNFSNLSISKISKFSNLEFSLIFIIYIYSFCFKRFGTGAQAVGMYSRKLSELEESDAVNAAAVITSLRNALKPTMKSKLTIKQNVREMPEKVYLSFFNKNVKLCEKVNYSDKRQDSLINVYGLFIVTLFPVHFAPVVEILHHAIFCLYTRSFLSHLQRQLTMTPYSNIYYVKVG